MNIEEIVKGLENRGYEVRADEFEKGGIKKTGIVFMIGDVQPIIYVDENSTADSVADAYENGKDKADEVRNSIGSLRDFEKVRDKIRLAVRPVIDDTNIIARPFLDLQSYCYINEKSFSCKIKKNVLDLWGITEDELFELAMTNTKNDIIVKTMNEIVAEIMMCDVDELAQPPIPMYVVMTRSKIYGSSVMLLNDKLSEVANMLDDDLVIIPSSVHEIIVIPKAYCENVAEIKDMIMQVNDSEVEDEDVLSSHPYEYSREDNEVLALAV